MRNLLFRISPMRCLENFCQNFFGNSPINFFSKIPPDISPKISSEIFPRVLLGNLLRFFFQKFLQQFFRKSSRNSIERFQGSPLEISFGIPSETLSEIFFITFFTDSFLNSSKVLLLNPPKIAQERCSEDLPYKFLGMFLKLFEVFLLKLLLNRSKISPVIFQKTIHGLSHTFLHGFIQKIHQQFLEK